MGYDQSQPSRPRGCPLGYQPGCFLDPNRHGPLLIITIVFILIKNMYFKKRPDEDLTGKDTV
jgi:hypothetical protein